MTITLYVIPASHPCISAELMLRHKGLPYKRRDLVMAMHKPIVRALGFDAATVPALKHDGRKVQGSTQIARYLDEIQPEPRLFPTDPGQRRAVEEAERLGDDELQAVARRLALVAVAGDRSHLQDFLDGYKLGVPTSVAAKTAGPAIWMEQKIHKAGPGVCRADVARVPDLIRQADALIADRVIGVAEPNAADFQIAPSIRLLMALDQLRPLIDGRPAGDLALKVVPDFRGRVPDGLPHDWVSTQPAASA